LFLTSPALCFFSIPLPPPPPSPLFPYTTLFRSAADAHPVTLLGLQHVLQSDPALQLVGTCGTGAQALQLCASLRPSLLITDVTLDRKSTRLNSSHVAISYAVFCLKKKKIKYTSP